MAATSRSWPDGGPAATDALVEEGVTGLSPPEACRRFLDLPCCLLLESAAHSTELGRYSFLVADPFLVVRSWGRYVELADQRATRWVEGDPFEVLRSHLRRWPAVTVPDLPPFQGGAAGFFAYDLAHHLERLPSPRWDGLNLPEMCVGFYDWVLAWDYARGQTWMISTGRPESKGWGRAQARAGEVRLRLRGRPPEGGRGQTRHYQDGGCQVPTFAVEGMREVRSNFSREGYLAVVERAREHIRAGNIFQVNLSQRLQVPYGRHPFELYEALRAANPAPFATYFDLGEAALVSASPERFLRLVGTEVETRPIKGTAARGLDRAEDARLAAALKTSVKDRAENVMIVDLLRNDLSRVCEDHSVRVPALCALAIHGSVHHLESIVTGTLRPGLDAADVLEAAFPGGSITGAPKVRAMELVAELEPNRRGPYTGAIGYIGFDGTMDTSIAIRTFVVAGGTAYLQAGGAITLDSDPDLEYEETLTKARGPLSALRGCADRW